jgi:hypothetical protein
MNGEVQDEGRRCWEGFLSGSKICGVRLKVSDDQPWFLMWMMLFAY